MFSTKVLEVLIDTAFWITLMLQIMIFFQWRRYSQTQKLIGSIVCLTLINHGLTWFLMHYDQSNLWVYHLYTPLLFALMAWVYSKELVPLVKSRVIQIVALLFVTFSLFNTLFLQDLDSLNSNTIRVSGLIFVCFSILYFYRLLKEPLGHLLSREPMVWLNSGILIYYSGTLIMFLVIDSLIINKSELLTAAWVLNALFNVTLLVTYGISLCLKSRN